MDTLEQLATAAIQVDALQVRSLVQDLLDEYPRLDACPRPVSDELRVVAAAASIVELLAARRGQQAPAWAASVAPLIQPIFLVRAAASMKRLRELCERESPEQLRRRGFFAPPNYLDFA